MNTKVICVIFLLLLLTIPAIGIANPTTINVNFVDEDIRTVVYTLAAATESDIVIDDSVKGKISIKLSNIPFEQAMDLIARAKGLSYRQVGNTIVVDSSGIGSTEVVKLKYARASEVKKSLDAVISGLKLKVEADEPSNTLIINGPVQGIDQVKSILTELDYPHAQVELEAKVIAVNKLKTKDLGIDWTWEPTPQYPEVTHEEKNTGSQTAIKDTVNRENKKGIIRFGRNPEGIPYEFYYQAKINALISHGDAKILARPKVVTLSGKEARILIGDRIPVLIEKTENNKTTTTIDYIDAGIKLSYTPTISNDGIITAAVHTEVSTPSLVSEMKAYRITTREAATNVRMKDGETMIIGGLIGSDESQTESKIPFLGDLPLLGKLFQSEHNSKNETEVVIFLTPHIVK